MPHDQHRTRPINVLGIVTPCEWTGNGAVVRVGISATDEIEYLVDRRGCGRELFSLLGEKVEATGVVSRNRHGRVRMTVHRFRVIPHHGLAEGQPGDRWSTLQEEVFIDGKAETLDGGCAGGCAGPDVVSGGGVDGRDDDGRGGPR